MATVIGAPRDRVDGHRKVTGGAPYAAEHALPGLVHAVIVQSTVASGRIQTLDLRAAEAVPGVLAIITHQNAPRLHAQPSMPAGAAGQTLPPLQDDIVRHQGQHLAVVVAETLEQARQAADLVRVTYAEAPARLSFADELPNAFPPSNIYGSPPSMRRGDPRAALAQAAVHLEQVYTTPDLHHNPLEPAATTAAWDGDQLTLYDATQYVSGVQQCVAGQLGIGADHVHVVAPFVGGGFGCKGTVWPHVVLAAVAARQVGRPVRLALSRAQDFSSHGYRPRTHQTVTLGATKDGKLTAIVHRGVSQTSTFDEFAEFTGVSTPMLYACDNVETSNEMVRLNVAHPTMMRAPGETPGSFALESALDELAAALHLDPIELRLRNYAERDPQKNLPWSSKSLRECYQLGAERFGWARRDPTPRSMRDDGWLVGWGMATATYPTYRFPASALVRLHPDGRAMVQTGSQDLGGGTYTVMTQVAAEVLGLPIEQVTVAMGDSELPAAPVSGGSNTTASVGSAVYNAALSVRDQAIRLAVADRQSPLHGADPARVAAADGRLLRDGDGGRGETYAALLARQGSGPLEARHSMRFGSETDAADGEQRSMHAFGAQFAEVRVDESSCEVRVSRWVSAFGAGTIVNAKTARSQLQGGIIFGIGMALMEHTVLDPRTGRVLTPNLSHYLVPVHADVPDIDVQFVPEHDPYVNPLGAKGVGELGIVGAAAAVANAVYHATGQRIRDLPITLDKLLG